MALASALVLTLLLRADAAAEPTEPEPEFRNVVRGVFLQGGYQVGTWGRAIPVAIDGQFTGTRSFHRRANLLLWNLAGGFTGGYGGNTNPKFFFYGANLDARADGGWRATPTFDLSPFFGFGVTLHGSAVAVTGTSPNAYDTVNHLDGLAGFNGVLAARFDLGLSQLGAGHSLFLAAFLQESAQRPGSLASGGLFTDVGVRGQLDLPDSFTVNLEASWGTTLKATTTMSTHQGSHLAAAAMVRKVLGRIWLSLDVSLTGNRDITSYAGSTVTYDAATPTVAGASLSVGVSL